MQSATGGFVGYFHYEANRDSPALKCALQKMIYLMPNLDFCYKIYFIRMILEYYRIVS